MDKTFFNKYFQIAYDAQRIVTNVEEKIALSTLFILTRMKFQVLYSDMLYNNKSLESVLNELNKSDQFKDYDISIKINLYDTTIKAYEQTVKGLAKFESEQDKEKFKYYECLAKRDSYALAIVEIGDKLTKFNPDNFKKNLELFKTML